MSVFLRLVTQHQRSIEEEKQAKTMVLTVGQYTVAEHEDVVTKPDSRNHDVAGVRSRIEGGKCQWGGLFARRWITLCSHFD